MNIIKRPLVWAAAAFAAGDACVIAGLPIILLPAAVILTVLLMSEAFFKKRASRANFSYIILLTVFTGAGAWSMYATTPSAISSYTAGKSDGIPAEVTGIIYKIQEKDNYTQIYLKKTSAILPDSISAPFYIRGVMASVAETVGAAPHIGDKVLLKGKIKEFETPTNPGGFNAKSYYESIGVEFGFSAKSVEVLEAGTSDITALSENLKMRLTQSFKKVADERDAGLCISIILGDKQDLLEDIDELYRNSGISHLIAISGMHISLIGMAVYSLLRKGGLRFLPCAIISVAIIMFYGMMTGNAVSTVRAVVMFSVSAGAGVAGRTYDILSSTSLSLLYILIINPMMLINCAFLLTFGAVLGMVVIMPLIMELIPIEMILGISSAQGEQGLLKKPGNDRKKEDDGIGPVWVIKTCIKFIVMSAVMSISVTIATLPVMLYFFFQIPLYSVVINVIVVQFMAAVMASAALAGAAGMVSVVAGRFFMGLAHYILAFYEAVCNFFFQFPNAVVVTGRPSGRQILLYYIILVILLFLTGKRYLLLEWFDRDKAEIMADVSAAGEGKETGPTIQIKVAARIYRYWILPFVTVLVVMTTILCYRNRELLEITMIDVGQGDCILVSAPDGNVFLFDGGSSDVKRAGKFRIVPVIKSKGMHVIDYVVISHLDNDHINAITEILETDGCQGLEIRNLVLPDLAQRNQKYIDLENAAKRQGINVIHAGIGDNIGSSTVQLKCIYPEHGTGGQESTSNSSSMTVSLKYREFDMLFTGDLEKEGENSVVQGGNLHAYEVLKVAHHGSKYSSSQDFLAIVRPQLAMISCGEGNSFGHPHAELIDRLTNVGSRTEVTAECGAITIRTDGQTYEIVTMGGGE